MVSSRPKTPQETHVLQIHHRRQAGPGPAGDVLDHRGVVDDEPVPKLVDLPLGLPLPLAGVRAGGDLLAKLEVARP